MDRVRQRFGAAAQLVLLRSELYETARGGEVDLPPGLAGIVVRDHLIKPAIAAAEWNTLQ